eukprot:926060-Prorocentrum_lima.AAC.1
MSVYYNAGVHADSANQTPGAPREGKALKHRRTNDGAPSMMMAKPEDFPLKPKAAPLSKASEIAAIDTLDPY